MTAMSGVGLTYLWPSKKFPPFVRLEGKRGDYAVYTPERTCHIKEDADTGCFLVCSECGAIQPEEWTVYYCWNCGAKVVE